MSQRFLHDTASMGRGNPIIGANSVEFSYADSVYINSSGFLALATTSSAIFGYYCGQGETMSATNQTVEKVCPDYVYVWGVEMVYGAAVAATQAAVGTYIDITTATTGAFQLTVASSTNDTFHVIGFDPAGDETTTDIVVKAADIQGIHNIS